MRPMYQPSHLGSFESAQWVGVGGMYQQKDQAPRLGCLPMLKWSRGHKMARKLLNIRPHAPRPIAHRKEYWPFV